MRALQVDVGGGEDAAPFYLAPLVKPERMLANMASAIARGLPETTVCKPHGGVLSIAAGGPSIADTYRQLEGWVCTINGSLGWLMDQEDLPEGLSYACGICDAGEHIADMIVAHPDVRYYVASVCDPSVFDKLEGCDVHLFHVTPASHEAEEEMTKLLCREYDEWSAIGGGCTMGLRWLNLGYFLGFRKFRLHGMDSSFRRGATHAYPDHADGKEQIELNGWMTRPNFVAQVYDFAEMLEVMWDLDPTLQIEVHGEGLLQDEWKAFRESNPRAFTPGGVLIDAAVFRSQALLRRLPEGRVIGAEVGVFTGRMSKLLLQRPDLELLMVDAWRGDGQSYYGVQDDWHSHLTQEDQDGYQDTAIENTAFAEDRRTVMHASSKVAADRVSDYSLDFVFIDADHSYEGASDDILWWADKVKPGGWLCGHDYVGEDNGVQQAVDEFIAITELTLELDDDSTWFIKC